MTTLILSLIISNRLIRKGAIHITIREARKAQGMTQEDLAKAVGTSQVAISYWENGQTEPNFEYLKRLSDVLHVTIDELVKGKLAS